MRNPISLTIEGLVLVAVSYLVKKFGLPFTEVDISTLVTDIGTVAGLVIAWWGRVRIKGASEVNVFGVRRG